MDNNFINQNSEKRVNEKEAKMQELYEKVGVTGAAAPQISPETMEKMEKAVKGIQLVKRLFFGIPIFLFGLIFFAVGVFATVSDSKKVAGGRETKGIYSDKEYSSLGGYVGIYTYEVNGQTYTVEYAQVESDPNDLPREMTVKYDPKDPSVAVIKSATWIRFALSGLAIMCVGLVIMLWGKISKLLHLEGKVRMRARMR